MKRIQLIVQADDFGMCHAVNEGVLRSFREGILTQAVIMPPCPWFEEAVAIAKRESIPVGMHCTLTCDWDHMRWRPISDGHSLVESDGTFHRTVEGAREKVDAREAIVELEAQANCMIEAGLPPIYFDTHMGFVSTEAYAHICALHRKPFLFNFVDPHLELTSFEVLSDRPRESKLSWMLDYLSTLSPGQHFLQTHPGVASSELRGLVGPGSEIADWAEEFRVADLEVLTHEEVIRKTRELEIELISVDALRSA
jgi:hypothetical protein